MNELGCLTTSGTLKDHMIVDTRSPREECEEFCGAIILHLSP